MGGRALRYVTLPAEVADEAKVARTLLRCQRVYPLLVRQGLVTQKMADKRIDHLQAVLLTLRRLQDA